MTHDQQQEFLDRADGGAADGVRRRGAAGGAGLHGALAGALLAAHLLEIPLAFHMLRGRNAQAPRVIVGTLLFGLIWWVPARRGVFSVGATA
jgi:hypothetical protein